MANKFNAYTRSDIVVKGLDRVIIIGTLLLIIGIVFAFMVSDIGIKEWTLLLLITVLGFVAGVIQGRVVFLNKIKKMSKGKMKFWIVGVLIVFVALKVSMNIFIPSYISTDGKGILLSIVFVIGGLFIGRSFYSRLHR